MSDSTTAVAALLPIMPKNDGDYGESQRSLEAAICLVFYVAIIVIFLLIVALIVKLMRNMDGGDEEAWRASESTGLLPPKEEIQYSWYGTREEDLESGNGGSSGSCCSSSDELYDGTICVICYDDQRSCFFIPCGHCVTCHTCANRILSEDNKSCPICRTFIHNVMKLHLL